MKESIMLVVYSYSGSLNEFTVICFILTNDRAFLDLICLMNDFALCKSIFYFSAIALAE